LFAHEILVILSEVANSRSELAAQSKDPVFWARRR